MAMELATILWNSLAILILTISAILFYLQMKGNHEWNRRRTAHDLIFQSYIGHFSDLRAKLEHKINIYDETENYNEKKAELDEADHKVLDSILNYLDNVCLAVKDHVVSEDIIFDCLAGILLGYKRWAKPYIQSMRAQNPRVWIELDNHKVRTWPEKREQIISGLVQEGERKL